MRSEKHQSTCKCSLKVVCYVLLLYIYIFILVCVQLFQAEMFSRQQILYSIINDGHHMLEQGQVDDR